MDIKKIGHILFGIFFMIISCYASTYPMDGEPSVHLSREKRDHHHGHHHHQGVTGPVHTFVKTDKHANFKWGVRHHVGKHYARR